MKIKIKKKLKKYGKGGEIPEKKKIEDSFVDANNFLKSWQQSPMYNEMLNTSSSGNEYLKISNYRNKSLNLNPTNNLNVEKTLLNDPNTTGFVRKGTPIVNISSDWHNNNEMLSRLKTESDTLKARLGETPDYKIPTNFVTPSTIVHEMSHITDWKGLPKTDLQKIKSFSSDRDKNKFSNYVANPSETRSRLNEIRYENSLLKYYNPLTEKINKDQYNNYLKDKSKGNALKDLKNVYSDDEIIDMLNSISENKSSQEQVPMAKNGGSIKKYGKGGSIKDDIININGDYYNNDIIDGLDRDARVLNNQENKFLNRYGVTDRNSFYNKFPTEEIFNFKNGSDKARHYGLSTPYVDETTITLKNGGSINKYPNGGRQPKYEWSKGIDNIQPITQTQNNSSITTGNKKLSTEELKKAAEYTKKYNQQHLEEEYNNRQNKLKQSIDAQKQPLSLKNLQTQTQSTGDKLSLAMNSKYGNPKDYPTLSGYIQGLDYINPFKMIGDMASGLGSVPQDVNEGNYLKAGLSVASPLAVGAMAGVGANSVKPFVNNLVNPLAGTGEAFSNLYKEQIYKAFEPVGYGAKEKILNSPKTWVRNTFIKSPEERAKHIGSQLSNNENLFEEVGKNRLDAWRTGLGLNQKWDTFEKIGENSYRIKNMKPSVGEFSSIYNDLNANEINKMGYYSGENPLISLTKKHDKVTSPKIQTEYGLFDVNDIMKYLRKGDKVDPWEQYRIVEPSKNKDFSHSVYDTDKQGIMGSFRWDINKPSYPDYNIHYQSNDTWDLNPFENRGATQLKNNHELSKFHFKPLENLEALKLVGGKPFNIQNNFLVDPKTYEIKKSFKNGGNITKESEWELVNEDLPKAGNGLSLVKTLTPIGNKVIPRNPSLYKDAINNVDKIEHNINDRYRVQADDFTDKNYPTDYDEDSGHNDYVDALRHSATAMYTTSGQGNFLAPLKVPYTNVMGLAHELKGLGSYVSNPDKLTWQGAKQQLRETGSDLYNNFVGSMIGGLPINIENKEKILKFAKDKNILSDLSKKQNGGKLPKRRLNLNKSSDWEIVD